MVSWPPKRKGLTCLLADQQSEDSFSPTDFNSPIMKAPVARLLAAITPNMVVRIRGKHLSIEILKMPKFKTGVANLPADLLTNQTVQDPKVHCHTSKAPQCIFDARLVARNYPWMSFSHASQMHLWHYASSLKSKLRVAPSHFWVDGETRLIIPL